MDTDTSHTKAPFPVEKGCANPIVEEESQAEIRQELDAILEVRSALLPLDESARNRVIEWARAWSYAKISERVDF